MGDHSVALPLLRWQQAAKPVDSDCREFVDLLVQHVLPRFSLQGLKALSATNRVCFAQSFEG